MSRLKVVLVLLVAIAIAAFFVFDLGQYLNLTYFKAQRENI